MKKRHLILPFILILAVVAGLQSCDSDFMDQTYEPKQYVTENFYITSIPQDIFLRLNIEEANKSWRIVQYPKFVEPLFKSGKSTEAGLVNLVLTVNDHEPNLYNQDGSQLVVVEIAEVGFLGVPLVYQLDGQVEGTISLNPSSLKLTNNEQGSFEVKATGNIDINWEIVDYPNWMNFDNSLSGWTGSGQSSTVYYNANATDLDVGQYEGEIKFRFNGENYVTMSVVLNVTVAGGVPRLYDGLCIGSGYNEASDLLLVVTRSPNRILRFKSNVAQPEIIELNRVPKGMALSEDQKTLVVSYSNSEITTYDAVSGEAIKTYQSTGVAECLAFGSSTYLYYLSAGSSNSDYKYLYSLNLESGSLLRSADDEGGYDYLRKVPGKNILITSKTGWSPEFIVLYYNTHQGAVNDMNEYRVTPYGIWPSDDGTRIMSGSRVLYKIPAYNSDGSYFDAEDMPVDGELEWPFSEKVVGMVSKSNLGLIYCVTENGSFDTGLNLHVYNASTLVEVQTIDTDSDNVTYGDYWTHRPTGVYPNANGTKVWVVQSFPDRDDVSKSTWRRVEVDIP